MNLLAWELQPESKHAHAQEAQRAVMGAVRALLEHEARPEMSADELEELSLQFKLAGVNLMRSVVALRQVEAERRVLAREREREAARFEPESERAGSPFHGGGLGL